MSEYPESIPESKKFDNFQFSVKASVDVKADLQEQLETLQGRIEKIIQNVLVGDVPIIRFVLNAGHDKLELKKLAKGIDRIADLIELHDQIETKLHIIKAAEKDPEWFAFAFGDFTQEIDKDINDIFN